MPRLRVLVVVKTYPHPSASYQELVCTAGVLEDGSFVRLYPIDFRYQPLHKQYAKYQWIEVEAEKNISDQRPESYRPNLETITLIGQPLSTNNYWEDRKKIVMSRPLRTMCELRAAYETDKTSLGIIKPHLIEDLQISPSSSDWKPKQKEALAQINMFDPNKKKLEKIPHEFSYRFYCDNRCKGHTMCITDWELGVLYLDEIQRLGSEEKAIESVKYKFFDDICSSENDTHFFVGTVHPYNSWIVLGAFYPKKRKQLTLEL